MDPLFMRKRTVTKDGQRRDEGKARFGRRTVKYWELYGTVTDTLGAGLSTNIIDVKVPDGHCAELYAIGFKPYSGTGTKETLDLEIGYDGGKRTGIRFAVSNYLHSCLPWGDNLNPPLMFDFPMRKGNLTIKYNEGQDMELILTADEGILTGHPVHARARVLLYEPVDVAAIFGVGISNFATLAGGVSQALPHRVFADYAISPVSAGDSKWVELYSKKVQDYEQIKLSHIGVRPEIATHFEALRLYDYRTKNEFPEYDPYFKIGVDVNTLPMGADVTAVPIQKLVSLIADYIWSNTTLYIYFRDDGTAVAAYDGVMQLLGTYRRVR